ncbi:unnamed protein product [Rotaria sp. Silwood1]|nr:unnamed protein product [Rotaria sp. Silwood1]CAF1659564.1 unnamed protein product [Rotaria sp. Silwood1]
MTSSLSSTVSIDKLIELAVKRMKELSSVVYSKQSSLKTPKLTSLLSSILACMTGTTTSKKIKTKIKHFVDCIDQTRFLSWLMIGSLKRAVITRNKGRIICHRIFVVASQLITDYILYILTSFVDQSKTSVIHLSLLFHSFILCQV